MYPNGNEFYWILLSCQDMAVWALPVMFQKFLCVLLCFFAFVVINLALAPFSRHLELGAALAGWLRRGQGSFAQQLPSFLGYLLWHLTAVINTIPLKEKGTLSFISGCHFAYLLLVLCFFCAVHSQWHLKLGLFFVSTSLDGFSSSPLPTDSTFTLMDPECLSLV